MAAGFDVTMRRTKKTDRQWIPLGLLLVGLATLPGCFHPPIYFAREIHGRVVDDRTDEPLEGVIIVAQWELFQIGVGHRGSMVNVIEVVTRKDGSYDIPGWGPRLRLPFGYLDSLDPELLFFKSGYTPKGVENEFRGEKTMNRSMIRTSQWNAKTIVLTRNHETLEDYAFKLSSFSAGLARGRGQWKSFPRMTLALDAENRRLDSLGLTPGHEFRPIYIEHLDKGDRDYLRRYEK